MISFDKRSTTHIWGHSPDGHNFYEVQELLDSELWKKYVAEYAVACDGVEFVCGNYLAFLCNLKRDRDAGSSRVVRADTAFELREFFKKSGVPVDDKFMARLENIDDRPVPKHAFDLLRQLRFGWLLACGSLEDSRNTQDGTLRVDVQLPAGDKFRDGYMYVIINGWPKDDDHPYVYRVSAFVKGRGCHAGEFTRDSADDVASFMEVVKKAQAWLEEKCRPPTLLDLIPSLDEDRLKEIPEEAQTLAMRFLLLVLDNDNLLGYTATSEGPVIKIEYAQDYAAEQYSYEVSIKPGADGRMGYEFKMRWENEETAGWTNMAEALCRILDRWPCSDE